MSLDTIGRCPHCNEPIPGEELVIDYRSEHGGRITAATCPTCVTVVTIV